MTGAALVTIRDKAGHLSAAARRGSGARGAALAAFLQGDVQADAATARRLIDAAEAAMLPRETGNAFSLEIGASGVSLQNAILDDAPLHHYNIGEFRAALEAWLQAIG